MKFGSPYAHRKMSRGRANVKTGMGKSAVAAVVADRVKRAVRRVRLKETRRPHNLLAKVRQKAGAKAKAKAKARAKARAKAKGRARSVLLVAALHAKRVSPVKPGAKIRVTIKGRRIAPVRAARDRTRP